MTVTLEMIRELVGEGLFVLGEPAGTRKDPTIFHQWDISLDAAIDKIKATYVDNFDDRWAWTTLVWLNSTEKGEQLGRELYFAEHPDE